MVGRGIGDLPDRNFPGCPILRGALFGFNHGCFYRGLPRTLAGGWTARLPGQPGTRARDIHFSRAGLDRLGAVARPATQVGGKIAAMLFGLALPVLGGLAFLLWRNWVGFPPIADITRQYSGLILVNPVRGLASAFIQWVHVHDLQTTLDLFSALFFIIMGIVIFANRRWRKVEWLIYMAINLLIFLSKESFQASSLQSMARYVLVLFPVFIALGDWLSSQSRLTRFIYATISATILIILSTLYALWVFIG